VVRHPRDSASIADALLVHVGSIVGIAGAIHDDAARSFVMGSFGGLGRQESIPAAFLHGPAAIQLRRRRRLVVAGAAIGAVAIVVAT
jgi:hypothetical protein